VIETRYTLLRSQKREVYEILVEAGLQPAEFLWSSETIAGALAVSRLTHRSGQHYFQFSSFEPSALCTACPGMYRTIDDHHPKDWGEQEGFLRAWAQCLKREVDTPDVWAEVAASRPALDSGCPGDLVNEPIPAVQADQIGLALARLSNALIRELSLADRRALLVRAKLVYLADAARRERSRDWMYMVAGIWASLVTALSLTEAQAARLQATAKAELGSLASLVRPKVQTPPQHERRILGIWPAGGHASEMEGTGSQRPG
jgi:hypothetical protein